MLGKFNRLAFGSVVAEFLGTAGLTLIAIILVETTAVSYFVSTSLAVALVLMVLIFGRVSGSHLNPAITFAVWTSRRIGTLRAISYIAVQMLGGLAGWQLFQFLADKPLSAQKNIPHSSHLLVAEIVGGFVLGLGFAAAVSRIVSVAQSALVYGAALFVAIMLASVTSIGLVNPAIALGIRSWGEVYIWGPVIGTFLGVNLYYLLFNPLGVAEVAASGALIPQRNSAVKTTVVSSKKPAARASASKTSASRTASRRTSASRRSNKK